MVLVLPGALLVGLSLGLLGSGGSILTVPILVYLVGQDEKVAIASSLAIVALISIAGSLQFVRERRVQWRTVVVFGIPGIVGTYMGAALSAYAPVGLQMLIFALVLLVASWFMLKPGSSEVCQRKTKIYEVGAEGFVVGLITGFVGVGGGFLIVPALILLGGLAMQQAVATSLVIIALKSIAGFAKYLEVIQAANLSIDWGVIGFFATAGILGSLVGSYFACRISQGKLKTGFGALLVMVALFVLSQSVPELV
ncbi:MAG: sulfite exporter TauE/SafE family protein [Pseudomonadales bacterium]|nr:sulfite exporter TauE/SafE family protein [Pseudomonadales bacterium]MBO6703711.1 sulfite exporter TauE/SafE family protein [Pseudomonadales bacterium]MBO7004232.1 sulfite exporter TauE/SafE family protein [Pseudomonadales bacterium]